ncbi:MAG: hypothetical protein AB7P16_23425 [Bradyrhizobium sp.]|uniref:hypothetical protein n=1 Tax=Bradyrhizobium sp. TaxID=376 RepID=UPI003D0B05F3
METSEAQAQQDAQAQLDAQAAAVLEAERQAEREAAEREAFERKALRDAAIRDARDMFKQLLNKDLDWAENRQRNYKAWKERNEHAPTPEEAIEAGLMGWQDSLSAVSVCAALLRESIRQIKAGPDTPVDEVPVLTFEPGDFAAIRRLRASLLREMEEFELFLDEDDADDVP